MRDKMFRSIAMAVVAAFTVGLAAQAEDITANTTSVSNDDAATIACGMTQSRKKSYKRCYRRVAKKKACKKVTSKPAITTKETTVTKTETIEKPVVIQAPEQKTIIQQPAVIPETPVVIDRYQKIHRSLIHLGLFPFNLFGQ